jgi:hypothetical protein
VAAAGSERSRLALLLRIGTLVVLTAAIERSVFSLTTLPPESYRGPVLMAGLVDRLADLSWLELAGVLTAGIAAVVFLATTSLGPRWEQLEQGHRLRLLTVVVAAALAWEWATYGYNFYFDRAHALDRLVLVALLPLVVWRPVFTWPFLIALLPILWQFGYPIGGSSVAAPVLPVRALILVAAFWLAYAVAGRVRIADFVFVLCCLIAAHYWISGYGKLRLGWAGHDSVGLLLPATYANGWLGFLEPSSIEAATTWLLAFNWPLKLATLLVECGALVALWRRSSLRGFLLASVVFHAGIFTVTGILFWQWMLLNVAVLILFFGRHSPALAMFSWTHLLLSIGLIGGGALWCRPLPLVWLDAPMTYTYRVEAIGESGRSYVLPPRFFAPYDYQFTLGGFRYLVPAERLSITWGAIHDVRVLERLEQPGAREEVSAIEKAFGYDAFDPARAAAFDEFVRHFAGTWSRRPSESRWWEALGPPRLLWTFPRGPLPSAADPIAAVNVHEVTSFFDGRRYVEVRKVPVRQVQVRTEEP